MTIKRPKPTRAEYERTIIELRAQLASTYHFASKELPKATELKGSGVLLTLHALGGREIIPPVVIRDGLSENTINTLQHDIGRSYAEAIALKPKVRPTV